MPGLSAHTGRPTTDGLRVGLVAGEPSGDLLGAGLMREIRSRYPDAEFYGIAGPEMMAAGMQSWVPMERLSVMGIAEVARHLPELLRIRRQTVRAFAAVRPHVVVGIDSPDFTLRVERPLRAAGLRTVHYVSPSIWAWRPGRIHGIRKSADHVLCLLPFEPALYADHGIAATFVGHPMAEMIPPVTDKAQARASLGLEADGSMRALVAVLPGSRAGEVERLGPVFAEAAALLAARHPGLRFIAPMASARLRALFAAQLAEHAPGLHLQLIDGRARDVLAAADLAVLASGTAALEAALYKRPMVVAYRISPSTYRLVTGLRLMKTQRYSLPNLLAGEDLVPELIQEAATPERIAGELGKLLGDEGRRAYLESRFAALHAELRRGADRRAAEVVLALAGRWPETCA